MDTRRAVILAAGNGSRMGSLTTDRPKPMVNVLGTPIVDRQLAALRELGIRDVTVVVGYQQHLLRSHLAGRVAFVENRDYRRTNSLYSLWLASDRLAGGALVMNGDVLFATALLRRLLSSPSADALLVDRSRTLDEEAMKVRLRGSWVVGLDKDLPADRADGENVGLVKLGPEGATRLIRVLDRLVAGGERTAWAPRAFLELAREWPFAGIETGGLPWTEIDTPDDLTYASDCVVPAIDTVDRQRCCA